MILHHWDTDGITSAAIYMDLFGEDEHYTPKIGNYYLNEEDMDYLRGFDSIVILDMNLPDSKELCGNAELKIYDHHRAERIECAAEHYNPYLWGKHYPSCTTVLCERFGYKFNHLVALGIVGDMGPKAKELKEWKLIEKVMEEYRITWEDLETAVALLDSSYKLNKRSEVLENVHRAKDLRSLLEDDTLRSNVEKINVEIHRWAQRAESMGSYYFLKMRTPYHIISSVTREIAWGMGKRAIVVNEKEDRDEFYIRSPHENFNAIPLIEYAREKGYRAGGKREVMGAVLPKGKGEEFAMEIVKILGW